MSQQNKRKRLTFKQKYELIQKVKAGATKRSILQEYGIAENTYTDMIARESELRDKINSYENLQKKSSKTTDNAVLEAALIEWFKQAKDRGDPVSGPIIREKALILNEKLNGPKTFKASNGWLDRFKKRFCIRNVRTKEGKFFNDPSGAAEFAQTLKAKIKSENLNLENIYNANESGISWQQLMACTSSLNSEEEESSGSSECKERTTGLFCANAMGSNRIPLLIIGKSRIPRCLSNIITKRSKHERLRYLESLGVIHSYQNSSWMDRCIFILWYRDEFIPRVLVHQRTTGVTGKVVLLIDNAPCHPSLDDLNAINNNFEVIYIPPSVTALIQPMDQGLIVATKKLYKKNLLRRLLISEKPEGAVKFLNELNLQDYFGMLSLAWDSVKSSTHQKAWEPLLGESFVLNSAPAPVNIQDPLSIDDACGNIQEPLPNVDAVISEPESPTDLLSFPYEICDQVCELLSASDCSLEETKDFLLKWFENDDNDNDCGRESLPESDVNFVDVNFVDVNLVPNIKCEPGIVPETNGNCQPDANINFEPEANTDCEPETIINFVSDIVPKIEENQTCCENPYCENPALMKITTSEAFGGLMKFKNWLKSRTECLPKYLDYIQELENVITKTTLPES
ncbi:tigger transposable element-derived protein 2-like [Belonocnema kinseyi]|uniref:tigger transposable element-derived protein 2-like n=1 Tax=Belonocnema kinseyi TaxID=2817044 RepID=UPI00143DC64B|nr:tigger transposable element-derived protein 2-like [Belonocnema kinseyi]